MNRVTWFQIALALLVSAAATPYAASAAETDVLEKASAALVDTAKRVLPGVVAITATKEPDAGEAVEGLSSQDLPESADAESVKAALEFLQRSRRSRQVRGAGKSSGFLVSASGLIVTARSDVEDADKIMVRLHNGKQLEAKLVGADPRSLVAVLQIEGENFPVLAMGDSSEVEAGQLVLSAGHPFGLGASISSGIVGAVGVNNVGTAGFGDYIQTDAAMHPGCSGGPLVNVRGEVIGMNLAIASQSGSFEGVGFAIPINMVKAVKDQIAESGKMVYSYLGVAIQEVDHELAKSLGLAEPVGVRVGSVFPDTPAQEAGLVEGDLILEMDGTAVPDAASLQRQVAFTPPGTQVTLTILRESERKKIDAKLKTHPRSE